MRCLGEKNFFSKLNLLVWFFQINTGSQQPPPPPSMYILFVQIHYSSWYWQFEAFANAASQPFWRAFKCKSESSLKVGVQFAQPQGGWSLEAVLAGRKHINGDGLVMRTLTHSIHTLTHSPLSYTTSQKKKLTILQRGALLEEEDWGEKTANRLFQLIIWDEKHIYMNCIIL